MSALTRRQLLGSALAGGLFPWTGTAQAAPAPFREVHAFSHRGPLGYRPSSLVLSAAGELVGLTAAGGAHGCGAVFALKDRQRVVTVHAFLPDEVNEGAGDPYYQNALLLGPDGALYGSHRNGGDFHRGLAYKLTPDRQMVHLHHFSGTTADGLFPWDRMTVGADGALYGSGRLPGWPGLEPSQIYRLGLDGELQSWASDPSWAGGLSRLCLGRDNKLYATVLQGGEWGNDSMYSVTPAGVVDLLSQIHATSPRPECTGGLVQAADGFFYGTTRNATSGAFTGSIIRLTDRGRVSYRHQFNGEDGARPDGLTLGSDGAFYGVTTSGGAANRGVLFRLEVPGRYTVLHEFDASSAPSGHLVEAPDGRLYGVLQLGGSEGTGQLYSVEPPSLRAKAGKG